MNGAVPRRAFPLPQPCRFDPSGQQAAADPEMLDRLVHVPFYLGERLRIGPIPQPVQVKALLAPGPHGLETGAAPGLPPRPAFRTAAGRSFKVTFAPLATTTPCSIAVRSSRPFPARSPPVMAENGLYRIRTQFARGKEGSDCFMGGCKCRGQSCFPEQN